MTVTNLWSGALTTSGARVIAKTSATSARLAVSTSASMISPVFFGPVTPSPEGVVDVAAVGLPDDTQHYYAIEEDGALDTSLVGKFRTLPIGPASFTIAASACALGVTYPGTTARTSNSPIFDTIRQLDPLMFVHMGDLHYRDITTNDVSLYRIAFDDVLANSNQQALYRDVPIAYCYDDHDGPGPNGDASSAAIPAMAQVYRERVPSYPVPGGDAPVYQSWQIGRVLFILSDTRHSRVPGVTILGAAQKAWMLNLLQTSDASALVWITPTPWMGLADDTWAGFADERDEVAAMFVDNGWADRMICLTGDYHGLGMDNGAGNLWGGFPCAIFCSLDSVAEGNGTPTTQYNMGATSIGPDRYGTVQVVDDGIVLAMTMTAYIGSTAWNSYTVYVATDVAGSTPPRELSLTYDDTVSRVRVSSDEIASPDSYHPAVDTFTRSVSGGWGTADSGQAWLTSGGAAADYLTTSGVGRVAHGDVGTRRFTWLDASWVDIELTGQITAPVRAVGAPIQAGYTVRMVDTNNFYCALANFGVDGQVHVDIQRRTGGTFATLATTVDQPYSSGFRKWIRVRAVGSTLAVKLWADGDPEPEAWGAVASDTDHTAGAIGTHSALLSGNTNTLPINAHFDNLTTFPPPPVTLDVDRSTDQVVWVPVRGGVGREVEAGEGLLVDDYEFAPNVANHYRVTVTNSVGEQVGQTEAVITPALTAVWVKSIARPFLNRPVAVVDMGEVKRAARNGVFEVKGRSLPVVVSDVRGSREFDLTLLFDDPDDAEDFDYVLASGDVVLVQVPPTCPIPIPTGYYVIGDTTAGRPARTSPLRLYQLPLTEVAAPGPQVVGATITWAGLGAKYASWDDLKATGMTWAQVLELIGSPSDVVVS